MFQPFLQGETLKQFFTFQGALSNINDKGSETVDSGERSAITAKLLTVASICCEELLRM